MTAAMRYLALFVAALPVFGGIPSPSSHFGHVMGEDRKLVRWADVVDYFRALDAASDAVVVEELGKTTEGRPLIAATIASPETITDLDRYRGIVAKLADPRTTGPEAAAQLVVEGKPVVLVTCSIHSTEVASTMTAAQFAHDLLVVDAPRHRAILENTILVLVPSLNPDGVDKVHAWYERWLGGPYEGAPMIELYHKYLGHDNNRDWYIFSQQETRLVIEKLHNAWRPQIVYDVHQMGRNGARIFVPPWIDPIDSNIDPLIAQQANSFGMAMAVDLTSAGRKGVLVNGIYDYFSPARHYQSYHGAVRLLSESASARYATPVTIERASLTREGRNYNAQSSSWNFLEPWPGGEWRLRDIVVDQLITFESVLYSAALRRQDLLRNFYKIGQRVIERGRGRTFVVPREQHDPNAASRLLRTLQFGDVEIERAQKTVEVGERTVLEGDHIIRLDQPYGAFAKTLLEVQEYPTARVYPGGPPKRPYDVTAHTLPLLMGVDVFELEGDISEIASRVEQVVPGQGRLAEGNELSLSPRFDSSWIAVNRLLAAGVPVHRRSTDGTFLIAADEQARDQLQGLATELGVDFEASDSEAARYARLNRPRVAIYAGHVPLMDEGWTRWILERYEFPFESVGNKELVEGITGEFDVLVLPDAREEVLADGFQHQYGDGESIVPPEFREGIGKQGAAALKRFVSAGGTILAFNRAASYAINRLGLPVENMVSGMSNSRFFGPGTLVNVEADLSHPLCFGMQEELAVWFESGPVFRVRRSNASRIKRVLRYPSGGLLASGWLLGQGYMANRSAVVDVPVGRGRVVLFGIRPQYRGQSNATFKMVFNGLFL